jgi:hypothetical protein
MKNSTFMAAASAVGGSIWVGVEGSMLMGFAAVAVYLLLTLAIQLCKGEPPKILCKFVNNNNVITPPFKPDKYEPKELKITRALNPKWKQDMEICEEMMRKGSKSFFTVCKYPLC